MCLSFKDDEPITGGADGRDHTHIRKFLAQRHKKMLWKPEVIQIIFASLFLLHPLSQSFNYALIIFLLTPFFPVIYTVKDCCVEGLVMLMTHLLQ